jgi:uncharacterized protein (DUF488 family)
MQVYTIGFTRKSAAELFGLLRQAGIRRLVDIRLRNSSQLAGFTRGADLPFFLAELCNAEYRHELLLAPSEELFHAYKKEGLRWGEYEGRYTQLLTQRRVEERLDPALLDGPTVLLCTEPTPQHCHRRLALEYLDSRWGNVQAVHL